MVWLVGSKAACAALSLGWRCGRRCGWGSVISAGFGLRVSTLICRTPMTDAMMGLNGLLGKTSDADMLRGMMGFAAARWMALGWVR